MGQILVPCGIQEITVSALAFTSSKMGSNCRALSRVTSSDLPVNRISLYHGQPGAGKGRRRGIS